MTHLDQVYDLDKQTEIHTWKTPARNGRVQVPECMVPLIQHYYFQRSTLIH